MHRSDVNLSYFLAGEVVHTELACVLELQVTRDDVSLHMAVGPT